VLCKQLGVPVLQTEIQTVYLDGNASSHFNPILDSMRIYFALLRFMVVSFSTAILDNVVFALLFRLLLPGTDVRHALLLSQAGSRLTAMAYNFATVKKLVFASRQPLSRVVPKYIALVVISAAVSYSVIAWLVEWLHLDVVTAKILVETVLFVPNFVVQRDLVFRNRLKDEVGANPAP
jgi:putative flippase GtrA